MAFNPHDSNLNSLGIVCAILFFVASSFVKGFAFTLALGVIISLFSAIFITRILLMVFTSANGPKKLNKFSLII